MNEKKKFCRLCNSSKVLYSIDGVDTRSYFICEECSLISVSPDDLPSKHDEKERYLTHQNGIQHEGYVSFLKRAIDPALEFIKKDMIGLDYGCGPAPTLSELLRMEGYKCEDYDPFFVENNLNKKFGYIFSTEVFEHFFNPKEEIEKIFSLLDDNGILIVMTEKWNTLENFSDWYYARDTSHVCFYHALTFEHICKEFGFEELFDDGQRVVILKKTCC